MTLKSFQMSFNNTHPSPSSPDTFPVIVHLSLVHAHMHTMPMHKIILLIVFIYSHPIFTNIIIAVHYSILSASTGFSEAAE